MSALPNTRLLQAANGLRCIMCPGLVGRMAAARTTYLACLHMHLNAGNSSVALQTRNMTAVSASATAHGELESQVRVGDKKGTVISSAPLQPQAQTNKKATSTAQEKLATTASIAQLASSALKTQVAPSVELFGQASPDDPTFVPRNPGIRDGDWNQADEQMVVTAQKDAVKAATGKGVADHEKVLLGKTLAELEALVLELKHPKYRAKQIMDGIMKGAKSVDEIVNIPKELKTLLKAAGARTGRAILHHSVSGSDGTRKFLLQLIDGRIVETVGIPEKTSELGEGRTRLTVCVSSQVGCPMRCTFCATGKGGFARNLAPHEIMDQVMTVQEQFGKRVTNVVFMGMGEPLLNLPSVVKAYHLLNEQLGIGARYITVSTVGVPNAIVKLAKADLKSNLAVSIHAPNQKLREQIIPSAKAYPLDALMQDCTKYYEVTGRRVTFQYTLLAGVNDSMEHAVELASLLRKHDLMSHVNIIPWNPVDESDFKRPSNRSVEAFKAVLEHAKLPVSVRMTRGLEAAAACGQLRNQFQKNPLQEFSTPT